MNEICDMSAGASGALQEWASTGRHAGPAFTRAHPRPRASPFRRLAPWRGSAIVAVGTGLFARSPASDASWNPATDLALATNYDVYMRPGDVEYNTTIEREVYDHVVGKAANKLVTQREYGLDEDHRAPLVGFIADLANERHTPSGGDPSASGTDVLLALVPHLVADGFQIAVHVSPGDERLEALVRALAATHPGRAAGAVVARRDSCESLKSNDVADDDAARRRVLAGADLLAVLGRGPDVADARAVACRYGAVPVSREKSGWGLSRNVPWIRNAIKGKRKKDGFEFDADADVDGARAAFAEAAASFGDENEWATIVAGVMDETRR